jgi:DNA-binding MarR family transcriptional regulator
VSFDAVAIAGRYAEREGCRFIGYQSVGIAVFSMNVRVLVLEQRPVPPMAEFLLRFMLEDIGELQTLAALLGLDQSIVRNCLIDLRRDELIDVADGDADNIRCVLTERGREAAQSLRQNVMQELTLPNVIYHGLLHQSVSVGEEPRRQYLRPKEAKDQGLVLVRAIPNRTPHPSELEIDRLDQVVKRSFRRRPDDPVQDIVAVKSILKSVNTLYEPAVMLEYETNDVKRERQVAFAVEGRIRDEYEKAFATLRGPELLADILSVREQPLKDRVRKVVPGNLLGKLGRLDDVEDLAAQLVASRQRLEDVRTELQDAERPDTRQVLSERIAGLEQEVERLERERNSRKVKYLWTPEIRQKLWEALRTAQERLLILSGFVSSDVVNAEFLDALRNAVKRGVKVWIGFGFDKATVRGRETRESQTWRDAENGLVGLSREFPAQCKVKDVGRSHEKRLICDNRFTFGGSFNLLSFSGDNRGRGLQRHEGADLIEDAAFCEELYARYLKLFFRE